MPRRNDIAKILVIGFALLFVPVAIGQISFDEHFALAKQGKLGARETQFAKLCGVDRSSVNVVYGRSLDEQWSFKRVASVGDGRNDAETDYLGNVEMWNVDGKPRLLNLWLLTMDVGSSSNELYCLDRNGRVTIQESLNTYEPVDGSSGGWQHLRIKISSAEGKESVSTNGFVDKSGSPISAPKLNHDDLAEANTALSADFATDVIAKLSRRTK